MPFFARPDLSDEQFKQLAGSQLTLSGQTRIASTSGLTLIGDTGYIPIIVTGGTNYKVMTYIDGQVVLRTSSGGGSGIYSGASPTTCTVGGLPAGTNIYGTGITAILQSILTPTVSSTCVDPTSTFNLNPSALTYERGKTISISGITTLNRGSVSPQYFGTSPYRSGAAVCYEYCSYGAPILPPITANTLSNTYSFGSITIVAGNNPFGGKVFYASGDTPIYNSASGVTSALVCGSIPNGAGYSTNTICGMQPWFWGSSVSTPTINQALLNSYTCKCVASSANAIVVDNYNVTGKTIWFAIPDASPVRVSWQGANNPSNNGTIGVGLFPVATVISVISPESCWVATPYKFYVSNYATNINYGMTFCK